MRIDQFDRREPRYSGDRRKHVLPRIFLCFHFNKLRSLCLVPGGGNDVRLLRLTGRRIESMNSISLMMHGLLLKVESTGKVAGHVFAGR